MQNAQTLEIVSRSHESIELGYPVLWAVLRSQYCYSQKKPLSALKIALLTKDNPLLPN